MSTIVRRLLATAALLTITAIPTTATAQPAPHISLQTGPEPCQLQAALENFPAGTQTLTFSDQVGHRFGFPVLFDGTEGGSDVLVTAGPFGPGTWTAKAGGVASPQTVSLGADCGPDHATAAPSTVATTPTGQLPFTGADPWPLAIGGLALAGLGGALLLRGRTRRPRG